MNTGLPVIHPKTLLALYNNQAGLNELYHLKGDNHGTVYPVLKGRESVQELKKSFKWIGAARADWMVTHAIIREGAELLESAATLSNWFKPRESPNYDNCVMELADLLFFSLTGELQAIGTSKTPATLGKQYDEPIENHPMKELYTNVTSAFCRLVMMPGVDNWAELCYTTLCALAADTGNEPLLKELIHDPERAINRVIEVYWAKSHLNKLRVGCGLFLPEGYDKTHFGHEDNKELEHRLSLKVGNDFSYWNYVAGKSGQVVLLALIQDITATMQQEYLVAKTAQYAKEAEEAQEAFKDEEALIEEEGAFEEPEEEHF